MAEIILYCRGECILYGGLSSGSTTFNKGIVTLLQSSRKLGTSLSVGWKLARSEWASSSGSSGPSASSRESVSRMKPAEIHSKTHISQLAFWLFCFFWLLTPASVHIWFDDLIYFLCGFMNPEEHLQTYQRKCFTIGTTATLPSTVGSDILVLLCWRRLM